MIFCNKCGSMMMPKQDGKKKYFICSCGATTQEAQLTFTESGKGSEVENLDAVEDKNLNPITDAMCPKCEHLRAHYWLVQARSADEPEVRFFQCEKCSHTWREK